MALATFTKFNSFAENMPEKVYNLGSDVLKVALTNTTPSTANAVLTDITEISYTNLSSRTLTISSSSQSGGIYKLIIADLTLTASGAVGPFRYAVIYDDTATNKELIGYLDYGSSLTLANGDTLTLDFDVSAGLIQIT